VNDDDREKIFWRNAAKLLKLDVQGVGWVFAKRARQ